MSLGQPGRALGADAEHLDEVQPACGTLDGGHAVERERIFAQVRTQVIPGLQELVDPGASPAELIAAADLQSRTLRAELERADHTLFGIAGLDDPACAEEREWVRGHLHDTALQILEFIAGDGFGTGLPAAKIARLAGGAAGDLQRWLDSVDTRPAKELLPELELIAAQSRELDREVEVVVVEGAEAPTGRQVELLTGAVREAVTNARKHAHAQHVVVRVECREDGRTAVTIRDDGVGMDLERAENGTGLGVQGSIVGRMTRAGGEASLEDAPGGGTLVTLVTPKQGG